MKLESLKPHNPLEAFNQKDREVILSRLQLLTPLCRMVSGDIQVRVEVNPESGWHWDFEHNVVRCDPKDLLEKPLDYLRFVMQHEAGHRKISRVKGVIPDKIWNQKGFAFMMNAIEDPRMNNYVADIIPKFREEMIFSYDLDQKFAVEIKGIEIAKIGKSLRFRQAGFEYINLWLKEVKGIKKEIDPSLPEDVRAVVAQTLEAARDSWLTYPTRSEVDKGTTIDGKKLDREETVTEYARASYNINLTEVWPLFKTLIDKDVEDLADEIKKDGKGKKEKTSDGSSEVSDQEQSEMTDEEAKDLAEKIIGDIEKKLNEHFESQDISDDKTPKIDIPTEDDARKYVDKKDESKESDTKASEFQKNLDEAKKQFAENERPRGLYQQTLKEVSPIINKLENELREIFIQRKRSSFVSGFRSGPQIDIRREIRSEITEMPDANIFLRRELPLEYDYAVEILIDLSGSMEGVRIQEAYKAVVTICEALSNIGIKMSLTGFNDRLYQYKDFEQNYDDTLREKTENMNIEVGIRREDGKESKAKYNDDAWAVKKVTDRIMSRKEKKKIVFVLSDGLPVPSGKYTDTDLKKIIVDIEKQKIVHIIGLGIGPGTSHVSSFYTDNIASVPLNDLADKLATKVRDVIGE
jgi:uncharacterized protein with von Willebrand factor type A (vWA) domain